MAKIVFLDEYSLAGGNLLPIKELGDYTGYYNTLPDSTVEHCQGAEIVISNKVVLSEEVIAQLPDLRLIAVAATGMNNVDLEAAAKRGIEVRNVSGYSTTSVAEATLASALALLRNISYYDRFFKSGDYARMDTVFHFGRPISQLRGKRWGIIGLGTIGHEVARLAEAFGCSIAYHSTSRVVREEPYQHLSLGELLATSDIVSIHAPLNAATANLIDRAELEQMKSSAIIINVARGGIINEEALAVALNERRIAGAALDVFSTEPLRTSPLYALTDEYRLLASPHTAWAADNAVARLIEGIAQNIREYLAGRERC